MTIDILSDLHIDFYFHQPVITEEMVRSVYEHIFTDSGKRKVGDILVVAGDLGHNNNQNIVVLHWIRKIFGYSHIVCVLGNHDYYLTNGEARSIYGLKSIHRIEGMRNLLNGQDGVHCLDGNIIEIEGTRFGGCDSWYDGKYITEHFGEKCPVWNVPKDAHYINELWKHNLADADYIYGIGWMELFEIEREKIEKIHKDVDIIITHVSPSVKKEHVSPEYRDGQLTGFFTFDGREFLEYGSMKYWIFGHTHNAIEYESYGVKCICNPMGYPGENGGGLLTRIRSIEI
jgi:DNA repair exonuclease SbcCD nuclease subunit